MDDDSAKETKKERDAVEVVTSKLREVDARRCRWATQHPTTTAELLTEVLGRLRAAEFRLARLDLEHGRPITSDASEFVAPRERTRKL